MYSNAPQIDIEWRLESADVKYVSEKMCELDPFTK